MGGIVALAGALPPAFLVGLGGALGALARYAVDVALGGGRRSTFAVNVLGSVALGAIVASAPSDATLALAGTGFCGAFTTFSTFAFETVRLFETGERRRALANAAVNLAGALAAVWVGSALAAAVW